MTITNKGLDNNGKQLYELVVSGQPYHPAKPNFYRASNDLMKLYDVQSSFIFDDIYHCTGTSSGTDHLGKPFTVSIDDSPVKIQSCRWPAEGNITIKITGSDDKEVTMVPAIVLLAKQAAATMLFLLKPAEKKGRISI